MDSTAQTAPKDSNIINETAATGEAWIGQSKQPLGTQKSSTNCYHGGRMDLTAQTAPRHSHIINQLLAQVTQGLDSANSPWELRNHQRTAVMGDEWIRHPKHP